MSGVRGAVVLCVAVGCAADASPVCVSEAALYGGEEQPPASPVELASKQIEAIGAVRDDQAPAGWLCSGVLVDRDSVLTARHCVWGGALSFSIGPDVDRPLTVRVARDAFLHDSLDLALLRLEEPVSDLAEPIHVAVTPPQSSWVGQEVTLAGVGETEDGSAGRRLFLTEAIAEVADEYLTVSGDGQTGACSGDSGGPMLLRDVDGHPGVVGVLSKGSASCRGLDLYVRVDAARDWLDELGVEARDADSRCQNLD